MTPRSIRLFLVDGNPSGLRTAEIGLSTCKAVACPRASLPALKDREEARRTGVYVLTGQDLTDPHGRTAVYVGEGDDVLERLSRHEKEKDFWEHVVFFVSKDENLTKAHVRFLEARLIASAREANRAIVMNQNEPEGGRLPEADKAEMQQFLEQVRTLLGIFGIDEFEPARVRSERPTTGDAPTKSSVKRATFYFTVGSLEAEGVLDEGGFIVRKGSGARKDARSSALRGYKVAAREALVANGVLKPNNGELVFTQDYLFTSSSAAASVVSGTSVNGRIAWKLRDGTTLNEWEERELADK